MDSAEHRRMADVANLEPEKQAYLLNKAVLESWPLLKLKQEKYRLSLEGARVGVRAVDPGFLLGDCTKLLETIPEDEEAPIEIDEEYEAELHRRIELIRTGQAKGHSLEEVMDSIRATLQGECAKHSQTAE